MTTIEKFKYLARLYNKTAWLNNKEMFDSNVWTLFKIVALDHDYPDYKTFMIDLGDYMTIDSNEALVDAIYSFVKDMDDKVADTSKVINWIGWSGKPIKATLSDITQITVSKDGHFCSTIPVGQCLVLPNGEILTGTCTYKLKAGETAILKPINKTENVD